MLRSEPFVRCRSSSIFPSSSAIGFSKSRKCRMEADPYHRVMRDTSPCGLLGYERAAGDVVPLALQPARVARAHLDGLADLAEEPLGFAVLARLLQEHRVAAARLLARIVGRQRLVFVQCRRDLALLLEGSGVKQMAIRGLEAGIGLAQGMEHPLDLGEVAAGRF